MEHAASAGTLADADHWVIQLELKGEGFFLISDMLKCQNAEMPKKGDTQQLVRK